jgi:mono/diheme cytochrome c family protein
VVVADCVACHTDPAGGAAFAGGRAIQTPFGYLLAANITPDRATGIGAWSDEEFDAAVRHGTRPGGSRLYPAMPYTYYTRMSRDEVLAIRAYLNTVPPIHAAIDSDQLPFPLSVRASMRIWDGLFFTDEEFKADPTKSPQWNRGAYIVEGPGHCGACHTPKNALGADKKRVALRGYSIQGWFAPDLTGDSRRGLRDWSSADIVTYLKTGHNRFAAASGPMAEEVMNSSSHMSDEDLQAIADFLKGQPDESGAVPQALMASDPTVVAGQAIYADLCSACHKADGSGVPSLIPNIAASASVASREPTSVLRVLIQGAQSAATDREPTAPAMPGFGGQLSDIQIAAVANYVRNTWGHAAPAVSAHDVQLQRQSLSHEGE